MNKSSSVCRLTWVFRVRIRAADETKKNWRGARRGRAQPGWARYVLFNNRLRAGAGVSASDLQGSRRPRSAAIRGGQRIGGRGFVANFTARSGLEGAAVPVKRDLRRMVKCAVGRKGRSCADRANKNCFSANVSFLIKRGYVSVVEFCADVRRGRRAFTP